MEVSNNTNTAQMYKVTKRGALIGGAVGLASSALHYGMTFGNYVGIKGAPIAEKKARISMLKGVFEKFGVDTQKTTISKTIKAAQKEILTKKMAVNVAKLAVLGAVVGFACDYIKNNKKESK